MGSFIKIGSAAFIIWMFITCGIILYTENDCLSKGYPEYKVSVTWDRYCLNLEGAVTGKVDKQ